MTFRTKRKMGRVFAILDTFVFSLWKIFMVSILLLISEL